MDQVNKKYINCMCILKEYAYTCFNKMGRNFLLG